MILPFPADDSTPQPPPIDADLKTCRKCHVEKPRAEFGADKRRPDGLFPYCKRCRLKDPAKRDEINSRLAAGLRHCGDCDRWLPPDRFYPNRASASGLMCQCMECTKIRVSRYLKENPEKAKEKSRKRYMGSGRLVERLRWRIYYEKHADRLRQRSLDYRKTPIGKAVQARADHRRRARVASVRNDLTSVEWREIVESQGHRCIYCNTPFGLLLKPTRDHFIPVSKGGGLTKSNVVAACKPCNSSKRDKILDARPIPRHKPKRRRFVTK